MFKFILFQAFCALATFNHMYISIEVKLLHLHVLLEGNVH